MTNKIDIILLITVGFFTAIFILGILGELGYIELTINQERKTSIEKDLDNILKEVNKMTGLHPDLIIIRNDIKRIRQDISDLSVTTNTIQELQVELDTARELTAKRTQRFCDETNTVWTRVTGKSMIPFSYNEIRSFKRITGEEVRIGDTIVYKDPRNESKTIHHSVIEILLEGLQTYGYGNNIKDPYIVPFDNVLYVSCTYGVPESLRD